MIKKVLLTITCGAVAVSMCACASGAAILDQAQDVVAENFGEVESYLPEEIMGMISGEKEEQKETPAEAVQEETSADTAEQETETPALSEPGTAAEDETDVAVNDAEAETVAEETVAEDETKVMLNDAEGETAAEETVAEDETKVMLNDAEGETAAEETVAEDETKVMLNDAEGETSGEDETKVALSETETKEDTATASDETETKPYFTGASDEEETKADPSSEEKETAVSGTVSDTEQVLVLDNGEAKLDGKEISQNSSEDVFISDDIFYYQSKDEYASGNPYGEGTSSDKHTVEEAAANPVLNITKAGTYRLSGSWEGQIRVDLGEDAKTDKDAKVKLILDGVKVECTVAPAILFKNVYECDTVKAEAAEKEETKSDSYSGTEKEDNTSVFGTNKKEEETTSIYESSDPSAKQDGSLSEDDMQALIQFFEAMSQLDNNHAENSFGDWFDDIYEDADDDVIDIAPVRPEDETAAGTDEKTSETDETAAGTDGKTSETDETAAGTDEKTSETEGITAGTGVKTVDTKDAGAVIVIAGSSESKILGSHVAAVFEDSKEEEVMGKQDGAITSEVSLVIEADEKDTASLSVTADKEGIETNRHLTINGGKLDILSADDGINANEDDVSVVTINGGILHIYAGTGEEGDAIDSNGSIVINDGTVIVSAEPKSDCGLDSDNGSFVNGGTVAAFGSTMEMAAEGSLAPTMNLQFAKAQSVQNDIRITDSQGKIVFELEAEKDAMLSALDREYTGLVLSAPELKQGETYHLFIGDKEQGYQTALKAEKPEMTYGPVTPADRPDGSAPADSSKDYSALSEYEDVFEHFGISMDDVKEYLEENADKEEHVSGPADKPESPANPFGGNRPEKPDNSMPNVQSGSPFANAEPEAAEESKDTAAGELNADFTLEELVTTFTGVAGTEEAKDAAEDVSGKEDAAGNETTVSETTETETETESATEAAGGTEKETAEIEKKDADVSVPFKISGNITTPDLQNAVKSLEDEEGLYLFYQMTNIKGHR